MAAAIQSSNFTFHSLPLCVIAISIGQFLLPFERLRMKRLSKYYKDLFNPKTTISTLTNNPSSSLSIINITSFWNILNYLHDDVLPKYLIEKQSKLSFTHEIFDNLPVEDYFMLKYLLIYYDDLNKNQFKLTSLACQNGTELDWNKLFNLLPKINGLCLAFNNNTNQKITVFMDDIFAFCTNIKKACFFKRLSFCRAGITDNCVVKWCQTMMDRDKKDEYFGIQALDLSFNEHISDKCMGILFECIAYSMPKLEIINLSSTSISDKTCNIIYDFYQTYYGEKDKFGLSLYSINIMRCDKITKNGENILSTIFMEEWCPNNFYIHSVIQSHTKLIDVNV